MAVDVRVAECHPDTCLDVEGPDGHTANVNPIAESGGLWRVDCDDCTTCVRAGLASQPEALEAAVEHVRLTTNEYWAIRSGHRSN